MYAGHFIYMTKAYYERATHDSYQSNVTIVRLKDQDVKNVENTAADFINLPDVYNVSQNTSLIRQLASIVDSLQMVMVILTFLSVLPAIVFILFVLGCFVNRKLRRIDMLESLKSVD